MNLNSSQVIQDFQILKNGLGLSDGIIDEAKLVIRKANEKGLVRGRTHTTLVAAEWQAVCYMITCFFLLITRSPSSL